MNEVGLIGLGVMGANLLLNIHDNYSNLISGFDICYDKINEFKIKNKNLKSILLFNNLQKFVLSLKTPRKIIILIPSGKYVDILLSDLLPLLSENDNLLDGGNEWYKNTEARQLLASSKNINYIGCGISGGEKGARNGPCMMAGGTKQGYDNFSDILNKICVSYEGETCVNYFGNGGIGNYIKMVHNGIEYALMQLISESYLILKVNYGLNNYEISNIFSLWNKNKLNSYLLEITIKILNKIDEKTNINLVDLIKDNVESKGTGHMTVIDALEKKVPINIIYSSLEFRNISTLKESVSNNSSYKKKDPIGILENLENCLYFCFILTFYQGLNLINKHYNFETNNDINVLKILKVWRDGCIIRCNLLNDIISFSGENCNINNLLEFINKNIMNKIYLEEIIKNNIKLPLITMTNCFEFIKIIDVEILHSGKLLQAMRDCFGSHMYERIDIDGKHHTNWID